MNVSCSIVPESHSTFSVFDEAMTIGVEKGDADASFVQVMMEWFKYARVHLLSLQIHYIIQSGKKHFLVIIFIDIVLSLTVKDLP